MPDQPQETAAAPIDVAERIARAIEAKAEQRWHDGHKAPYWNACEYDALLLSARIARETVLDA